MAKQVIVLALLFIAVAGLVSAAPPSKEASPVAKSTPPSKASPAPSKSTASLAPASKSGGSAAPAPSSEPSVNGGDHHDSPGPSPSDASVLKISAVAAVVTNTGFFLF